MMKRQEYSTFKNTIFRSLLLLFGLIIGTTGSLPAQNNNLVDDIRLTPLHAYNFTSDNTIQGETPVDPRIFEVGEWLNKSIANLSSRSIHTLKEEKRSVIKSRNRAKSLREVEPGVKIIFRPEAGTPRQIKGKRLERSVPNADSVIERDKKTARAFLRSIKGILRINEPDHELRLYERQVDNIGRRHLRFSQQYGGIPVWPAELIVHLNQNGDVDMMDGAFVKTPKKMITQPVIDKKDAIKIARKAFANGQEADVSEPNLIIYAPNSGIQRLAWKIELSGSAKEDWLVIVDALHGLTLTAYNQVNSSKISGAGIDLFGEIKPLNLWQDDEIFYMVDSSKEMYDGQSNPIGSNPGGVIIIGDYRNQPFGEDIYYVASDNSTAGWIPDAVSLAYNLSETYDYYLERHNRNSIDGNGSTILGAIRLDQNYDNAFWNSDLHMMFFGDAQPYTAALDVVAHELAHGVTSYTANLIYQDQSGALNESFSDIFGEMADARTRGSADWVIPSIFQEPFRDLKDPSSIDIGGGFGRYPSKMSEYIFTNEDRGGVHLNMTIVAHAFYLLAEGLDGAIGIRDAERIFYRALAYHLVANSQLIDSRLACVASAEELFGEGSAQALKTAEAFDAVEIFENIPTPEPSDIAPIDGPDSLLFIYYDTEKGNYLLGRREQEDPEIGVQLSCHTVAEKKPCVSGDGSLVIFVNSQYDLCKIDSNPSECEECLGYPGLTNSIALSPDQRQFAIIFFNQFGMPSNSIGVIDIETSEAKSFHLTSPVFDGDFSMNTILLADTMDFTADSKYIIYDAFNVIQLANESMIGTWSIYAIDIETGQIQTIVPPALGYDISYPGLSQTSDNFITFDVLDIENQLSFICTGNLNTGELKIASLALNSYGIPSYNGDDTGIIFTSANNYATPTGGSILEQAVSDDRITPVGSPSVYMVDGEFGVIYRRGAFNPPSSGITAYPENLDFGNVPKGNSKNLQITLHNAGTEDLKIKDMQITGNNLSEFHIESNNCTGNVISSSGSCVCTISFVPGSSGVQIANLTVSSDDHYKPSMNILLTGSGISNIPYDGDVAPLGNRDGIVNVGDALVALRFALNLETPTEDDMLHGDVAPLNNQGNPNPDGKITVGDALVILRKALGIIQF
jgi:bacillolysin